MQDHDAVILAFVGTLLFLFAVYHYFTWHRQVDHHPVLMNMEAHTGSIQGIQHEQRLLCPRKAHTVLRNMVVERRLRAVLLRDGSAWVVYAGERLTVSPVSSTTSDPRQRLTVYYMRQAPPHTPSRDDANNPKTETATTAAKPNTTDAVLPPGLENMVQYKNSAINPTALVSTAGGSAPVVRFATLAEAVQAFPATDPPGEATYIMTNGPNDPSYYVVRTKKEATGVVITVTGLPGTVYGRKT